MGSKCRHEKSIQPSPAAQAIIYEIRTRDLLWASGLNQREGGNYVREGQTFRMPAPKRPGKLMRLIKRIFK